METVATYPKFGSVEYFADIYRRDSVAEVDVLDCMSGCISAVIGFDHHTDAKKVECVRNALAAGELVRAEMRKRDGS